MLPQTLLAFAIGLAIILISSTIFLRIIQRAADKWKVSPLVMSIVVVALGTTLPELALTISAVAQNDPGLAIGNILGSSVLNITLVLGVATLFGSVRIGTKKTQRNAWLLLGATTLFIAVSFSTLRPITAAAVLIIALILSLIYQYMAAVNGRTHEDKKVLASIKQQLKKKHKPYPTYIYAIGFVASAAGLGLGGHITVTTVTMLSEILNLSTTILGLTLTAVATSLPELVVTVLASAKHNDKVVVGTLLGSNIFNLTLFPAIILLFAPSFFLDPIEFAFLLLASISVFAIIRRYKGTNIPKKISIGLIGLFIAFVYASFIKMAG